ncbi:MAG: nucleotidyltransferase family protein [Pseudomonadota bacterium]
METRTPDGLFTLLLGAGAGSRFGSAKQLAEYDGQTLLGRALKTARAVTGSRSICVIGANAQAMLDELTINACAFVLNADWQSGQASSIRAGVRALPTQCRAVLIWHVDQPLVTVSALGDLISAWQSAPDAVVAARFAGNIGPPVIFPARLFTALRELQGDRGGKRLINEDDQTRLIDMPAAAFDVDTKADLAKLDANYT